MTFHNPVSKIASLLNDHRQTGTTISTDDIYANNPDFVIEHKCYNCDTLIQVDHVYGGHGEPEQCLFQLCPRCIRWVCSTTFYKDKKLMAGINGAEEDPQPCQCSGCKEDLK